MRHVQTSVLGISEILGCSISGARSPDQASHASWPPLQPESGRQASNQGENQGEGDGEGGDEETKDDSAETFSFGRMCAFSNEVMGQKTEGRRRPVASSPVFRLGTV